MSLYWTDIEVQDETVQKYCRVFTSLRKLPEDSPVVQFTPAGKQAFKEWDNVLQVQLPNVSDILRGPFGNSPQF